MDAFTIRECTRADLPLVNALIADSARVLSRGFYSEAESESAIRFVFGADTTLIDDQSYFVVVATNGDIAGCGGWSFRNTLYGGDQRPMGVGSGDESSTSSADRLDPACDAARIRAFFVSPAYARRGIGRLMLNRCVSAAAAAGYDRVELMATLPGVPFYAAMGFVEVEPVIDTLPDGTPLRFIRMTRSTQV